MATTFKRVSKATPDEVNASLRDAENKLTTAEDRISTLETTDIDLTADVTGTLPVANGGTGATTLTGLLTGNGTSAITGSVVGMVAAAASTGNVDSTSTTYADVTGVSITLVAGGLYEIRGQANATAASGTPQFKWRVGGTATATNAELSWLVVEQGNPTTVLYRERETAITGSGGIVIASSVDHEMSLKGTVTVNAGGTMTLQFARNAGAGTARALSGVSLVATRIS